VNSSFSSIKKYLKDTLDAYSLDTHSIRMARFLRKIKNPKLGQQQILVEAGQPKSNQLALSIFLPIAQKYLGAHSVFYEVGTNSFFPKLKTLIRQFCSPINHLAGAKFLYIGMPKSPSVKIEELIDQFQISSNTPELIEDIEYREIVIGDLIYDTYLRRTNLPTIDLGSIVFRQILAEAISLVDFWFYHFAKGNVTAVCVSHCVYLGAIPARVGVHFGIHVFQVNTQAIYRVTAEYPHAYTEFVNYREEFLKLPNGIRKNGLALAQERLHLRFSGEIAVDMPYSTKSAYSLGSQPTNSVIRKSERLKVLIAVHDFFDSPHSYGNNFYPDFYIWLQRLNELSLKVNYDWYIKTHPDIQGPGEMVLKEFLVHSNDFTLIPSDTSHHDLIRDGIDCVLTVFGTIAMEYPYLGKTVVNASRVNPHVAYNFSITPMDKIEYENTILNLKDFCSHAINKEEILEYYFMHNIQRLQNWVFLDPERLLDEIGGYDESNSSKIYSYFLLGQNRWSNADYQHAISAFLRSSEIRLNYDHFNVT